MNPAAKTTGVPLRNKRVEGSGLDHEVDVELKIQGHASNTTTELPSYPK